MSSKIVAVDILQKKKKKKKTEKIRLDMSCELFARGHMKCQAPSSLKNKKKKRNRMPSAVVVIGTSRINIGKSG